MHSPKPFFRTLIGVGIATSLLTACGSDSLPLTQSSAPESTPETTPAPPQSDPVAESSPVWEMVWSDEFDGASVDTSKWTYEVNCSGGGNQERQCYTDDPANSFIDNGMLNIVAMPAEEGAPLPYTSARIISRNKADFTYGRFEVRAKLPFGQGTWPAFWMLPTDEVYGGWPRSGEIDVLEAVNLKTVDADTGEVENDVVGTLHYGRAWPNNVFSGKDHHFPDDINPADDFHTYTVEWNEGEIRWYVDDYLYQTQRQSEVEYNESGEAIGLSHRGWFVEQIDPVTEEATNLYSSAPFDQDFFMILNLAVGGNFPENTNNGGVDASAFENGQTFLIDYVRVYQCSTGASDGTGCETVREGYDDPADALTMGAAPVPSLMQPPATEAITIFGDEENAQWPMWDCCGGTTPMVVADDADHGAVAEFSILNNDGTVLGFNSRGFGQPFNASGMVATGALQFDMKVVSMPESNPQWWLKVESDNATTAIEIPLNTSIEGEAPVEGQWQRYTFPLQMLNDMGLDPSAIDVVMLFPTWGQGGGAVFRVDNLVITPDGPELPDSNQEVQSLTLFEEGANPDWPLWDCCGGSTPTEEMDDAEHGLTAQFTIGESPTVMGFLGRDNGQRFDASGMLSEGVVQFDMKVITDTVDPATPWLFKVESNNAATAVEVNVSASLEGQEPVTGEWQTYTFPLTALANAGLDVSAIDVVMMFPTWGAGQGAVYRVDNAKIYVPGSDETAGSGAATGNIMLSVFADAPHDNWPLWDCCAGTMPSVVTDDAEHGAVAQFDIFDNNGTVLGFYNRDSGQPFDASSIVATGKFQFEMKVVNAPIEGTPWLFKVESNNAASAVELPLTDSHQGIAPVTGEWQTYTFDLQALQSAGLDVSAIDVLMVFPMWGQGQGAQYRIDNVVFTDQ